MGPNEVIINKHEIEMRGGLVIVLNIFSSDDSESIPISSNKVGVGIII